jgi:hypothetical protein
MQEVRGSPRMTPMTRLTRGSGYRFIDGEITGLTMSPDLIDFRVDQRRITVERSAVTETLKNGDRLRALVQCPYEDPFHHVLAFQGAQDRRVHYTGPALSLHPTIAGATLAAVGLYAGLPYLLISAACLFALEVMFSLQRADAMRHFHLR